MDIINVIIELYKAKTLLGISTYPFIIILIAFQIIGLIGMSKIFTKAKRNKYHAFIPFLNQHHLFDLSWENKIAIIYLTFKVFDIVLKLLNKDMYESIQIGVMHTIAFIVYLNLQIIMKLKLARSFNKDLSFAIGLIFVPDIFFYLLGNDDSVYLGRTLRKYNTNKYERNRLFKQSSNKYLFDFNKRNSLIALIAASVVLIFACMAIGINLVRQYYWQKDNPAYVVYNYFTTISNTISALGSAFLIPFAYDGLRRKRFVFPKWISLIQYSGVICTSITFIFAIFIIMPTQGVHNAIGEMNFFLHVICPISNLVLFFSVETDFRISLKESIFCLLPFYVYSVIYYINVVIIGVDRGGWYDFYYFNTFIPASISLTLMYIFSLFISTLIGRIYNKILNSRQHSFLNNFKEDLSDVEIKIEVFGLGRYNGLNMEINSIVVPIDIFKEIADKYNIKIDDLTKLYFKGVMDGLNEQELHNKEKSLFFNELVGTPEFYNKEI